MRTNMLLMATFLYSILVSGCGGGASSNVIGSTNTPITSAEVFNQTLYVVPVKSNPIAPAASFQTYSGATRHDWTNSPGTTSATGMWSLSPDGTLTFNDLSGNAVHKFTRIQVEPGTATLGADKTTVAYWLVYDQITQKNYRIYFDAAKADDYATNSSVAKYGLMGGTIQNAPLAAFSNVSTVTGTTGTSGFRDYTTATAPPAQFNKPHGITTTDGMTFFVTDRDNNAVRMLKADVNGVMHVSTLKTAAGVTIAFNAPSYITSDGTNLYVTDTSNYVIKKISPDTSVSGAWTSTNLAGTGVSGAIDGTGNTTTTTGTAQFVSPVGITTDGTNLYVTDDHAVRKVRISDGSVTTLAGSLGSTGTTDGAGTAARFNSPSGITTDGTSLYVADSSNYAIRRVVIATGVVTTIAGSATTSGSSDGGGTQASFSGPEGITTDGTNLYVTDWGRATADPTQPSQGVNPAIGHTVRKVEVATGLVTTIAGTSPHYGSDAATVSPPTAAHFYYPSGIITDSTSLIVADMLNFSIRRIK